MDKPVSCIVAEAAVHQAVLPCPCCNNKVYISAIKDGNILETAARCSLCGGIYFTTESYVGHYNYTLDVATYNDIHIVAYKYHGWASELSQHATPPKGGGYRAPGVWS